MMSVPLRVLLPIVASGALVFLQPPELLVVNGRIFTGVASQPWAEAMLSRGERIVAIGSTAAVRAAAGSGARIVDAAGRLVVPGLIDAHAHPTAAPPHTAIDGPPAMQEDPTLDVMLGRIAQTMASRPGDGWITGIIGGRAIADPRATRATLDPVTGARPLLLRTWHGHGLVMNSAAMRALGIGETDPDPPGGWYGRVAGGRTLSGLAHEYADYRARLRFAMLADRATQLRAYQAHAAEAASFGITSLHAMMTGYPAADAAALMREAALPVRTQVIDFPFVAMSEWQRRSRPEPSGLVSEAGTKWIVDGTPIERLMFLRESYRDAPGSRGRLNFSEEELRGFLVKALAAGEQPMFHAVGDAALDLVLRSLASTGGERWRRLRPRIEHGDLLEPGHFAEAKRLGVVLVQNPSHLMLGPLMRARLGARVQRAAMLKTTIAAGVPVAFGSDGPLNPFLNIMFSAINEVNPSEALTVEQALAAYTHGSAFAGRQEDVKGTLASGRLADFAILSQDIFRTALADLPKTSSVLTVVGGRIVHERR